MKGSIKGKIKNTLFWGGLASSALIFVQSVATLFGYHISEETIAEITASINSLLAILSFSGVLVNPEQVNSFQVMMNKKK